MESLQINTTPLVVSGAFVYSRLLQMTPGETARQRIEAMLTASGRSTSSLTFMHWIAPAEKDTATDRELQFTLPDVLKVPPISHHGNVNEIVGKFGGADQLRNAVNQLQSLFYAA